MVLIDVFRSGVYLFLPLISGATVTMRQRCAFFLLVLVLFVPSAELCTVDGGEFLQIIQVEEETTIGKFDTIFYYPREVNY